MGCLGLLEEPVRVPKRFNKGSIRDSKRKLRGFYKDSKATATAGHPHLHLHLRGLMGTRESGQTRS